MVISILKKWFYENIYKKLNFDEEDEQVVLSITGLFVAIVNTSVIVFAINRYLSGSIIIISLSLHLIVFSFEVELKKYIDDNLNILKFLIYLIDLIVFLSCVPIFICALTLSWVFRGSWLIFDLFMKLLTFDLRKVFGRKK